MKHDASFLKEYVPAFALDAFFRRLQEKISSSLLGSAILWVILFLAGVIGYKMTGNIKWMLPVWQAFFALLAVLIALFMLAAPVILFYYSCWTPKCPGCKRRMKRQTVPDATNSRTIYFVCHECKLYASSYIDVE